MPSPKPVNDPDFDAVGWDKGNFGASCPDMNKSGTPKTDHRNDPQSKQYGVPSTPRP